VRTIRPHEIYPGKKKSAAPAKAIVAPDAPPPPLQLHSVTRSLISGDMLIVFANRTPSDQELASIGAHLRSWAPSTEDAQHLGAMVCTRCRRTHSQHREGTRECPNGAGVFAS
jgi:hypothetical protein